MKRTRSIILVAILLLSTMVVFVTPAVAEVKLWIVPENPTRYIASDPDDLLNATAIADVIMGTTFSGDVLVLNQNPADNPGADDVYLKFFVREASNIENITIGTADRIQPIGSNINPNVNSTPYAETLYFTEIGSNHDVSRGCLYPGYAVNYSIGDIPWSGGPSKTGNIDGDDFNPDGGDYYIKVPFTINFTAQPEPGFFIYIYAENQETDVSTIWSHDCAYNHVPEFTTIAIPIVALLGLFAFYRRKQKK